MAGVGIPWFCSHIMNKKPLQLYYFDGSNDHIKIFAIFHNVREDITWCNTPTTLLT